MNPEPFERIIQDDQPGWPEIASAIGRVVATSAWATIALQEMASAIAGSTSVFFLMEDGTMGTQIKQTRSLIQGPERWTSQGAAAHLRPECRDAAMECLSLLEWLTRFRNRIVHDEWYPDERVGDGDGLLGRRATRFGKVEVLSRRATFHRVAYSFYVATQCVNHTTTAVYSLRDQPEAPFWEMYLSQARDSLRTLAARRKDADAQSDAEWLWLERPSG